MPRQGQDQTQHLKQQQQLTSLQTHFGGRTHNINSLLLKVKLVVAKKVLIHPAIAIQKINHRCPYLFQKREFGSVLMTKVRLAVEIVRDMQMQSSAARLDLLLYLNYLQMTTVPTMHQPRRYRNNIYCFWSANKTLIILSHGQYGSHFFKPQSCGTRPL